MFRQTFGTARNAITFAIVNRATTRVCTDRAGKHGFLTKSKISLLHKDIPGMRFSSKPSEVVARNATVIHDGNKIEVTWSDGNTSRKKFAEKERFAENKRLNQPTTPAISWKDMAEDDEYVYRWLKDINEHGISLITGTPATAGFMLESIPKRIAPLVDNTYGKVYDLITTQNPINYAFTHNKLQIHMDLVYYESTPGIQLLHCIRFDDTIKGGETYFVDMFAISEELRKSNPNEFKTLCTVPCTFARIHTARDDPAHLVMRRPIINLNKEKEIIGIFWNPVAVGPLEVHEGDVDAFYRAYQLFAKMIANFHIKTEVRLKPGEIIAYNNRRMGHGRNAFSPSIGQRHIQGSYISISDYLSRLHLLSEQYGDGSSVKRVGNMDWL